MNRSAIDDYEILYQIGRGSYASVHKAINKKTGAFVAIKKMATMKTEFIHLKNELDILNDCDNKNIVRYIGSECGECGDTVSIFMEYCSGGSVKDVMRELDKNMNHEQIVVIVRDVLEGLDYLDNKKLLHRDVKAANILLTSDGIAKLSDFGVSEPLDSTNSKQSWIGTLLWLPPEVLRKDSNLSSNIDIWSLGITIIEMADGRPPYGDIEESLALEKIKNLSLDSPTFNEPTKWSQSLRDFLALCLDKDKNRRKSARELLNCDIIKTAPSNEVIKNLVIEVDSKAASFRSNESEINLSKKCECLVRENQILFNIYKERRMKVVRVDQLSDSWNLLFKGFVDLWEKTEDRIMKTDKMMDQNKLMLSEIYELEKNTARLSEEYEITESRNKYLTNQLTNLRKKFVNDEMIKRKKLNSLMS